jgi:dihydroneopterin aldolase
MIIIGIEQLKVHCIIGCLDQERITLRDLLVDVKLSCHLPESDTIQKTVDYVGISEAIEKIAIDGHFHLLESLAVAVVRYFFKEYTTIQHVWVKIVKPGAIATAKSCFVEYSEERS